MKYFAGGWQLDTATREVAGPKGSVPLRPQVYQMFRLLLERAPAVVTKEQILTAVWEGDAVSDTAIAQVIRELRGVLGDDAGAPALIATRHRQGYQMIVEVQAEASAIRPLRPAPTMPRVLGAAPEARPRRLRWASGVAIVLAALLLGVWWGSRTTPEPRGDGWPSDARAAESLQRGLYACRLLDTQAAIEALRATATIERTVRLRAQQARLLLLRGARSEARELIAGLAANAATLDIPEGRFVEAVAHEVAGRADQAATIYGLLARMHPEDPEYALAWWETDPSASGRPIEELEDGDLVPLERRLLIAAQAAGRRGDRDGQLRNAEATLIAAAHSAPVVAALAEAEKAAALAGLDRGDASFEASLGALDRLFALGELAHAFAAWRAAVVRVRNRGQVDRLQQLLDWADDHFGPSSGTPSDPVRQAELAVARGRLHVLRGETEPAFEQFDAAVRIAREANAKLLVAALQARAGAAMRAERYGAAREDLDEALRRAESADDARSLASVHNALGNLHGTLGRIDEAIRSFEGARAAFRKVALVGGEIVVLSNLAYLHLQRGDLQAALELNREVLALSEGRSNDLLVGRVTLQVAMIERDRGELDTARRQVAAALETAAGLGVAELTAAVWILAGDLRLQRADLQAAREALDEAEAAGHTKAAAEVELLRARIAREARGSAVARQIVEPALRKAGDSSADLAALDLELLKIRIDLDEGFDVRGEATARSLVERAGRDGLRRFERDSRLLLAEALAGQGHSSDARREMEKVEALLSTAPGFEARLRLETLRAATEAPDAAARRLALIVETARNAGFERSALEAEVARCRLGLCEAEEQARLESALERRGLDRLRRHARHAFPG